MHAAFACLLGGLCAAQAGHNLKHSLSVCLRAGTWQAGLHIRLEKTSVIPQSTRALRCKGLRSLVPPTQPCWQETCCLLFAGTRCKIHQRECLYLFCSAADLGLPLVQPSPSPRARAARFAGNSVPGLPSASALCRQHWQALFERLCQSLPTQRLHNLCLADPFPPCCAGAADGELHLCGRARACQCP